MDKHQVASGDEWLAARKALLVKEKEFTRLRDELSRQRRALPWEPVTKRYVFDGAAGPVSLGDLFGGCSQLIVYHFMFPVGDDAGCPHCSFWADNFNGIDTHLAARDVALVAVSRAPFATLAAYQKRMGWNFAWYSSEGTDFNYDLQVSFTQQQLADGTAVYNYSTTDPGFTDREGISVFAKDDDGRIFHTYSTYARGIDMLNGAYHFLDLVPKGRDEAGHAATQFWVRRHDEYSS